MSNNPFLTGSRGSALAVNPMAAPAPGRPETSGPLSALHLVKVGRAIKFPQNIETIGNYMKIVTYKEHKFESEISSAPGASSLKARKDIEATCYLPMPSGLATAYNQNYDDSTALGPIGATAATGFNEMGLDEAKAGFAAIPGAIKGDQSDRDRLQSMASGGFSRVKQELEGGGLTNLGIGLAEEGATAIGTAAGDVVGSAAAGALTGDQLRRSVIGAQAGLGVARNPHMAVIYKTPNFRVFNFSWEFRPKDRGETTSINAIVNMFKYYQAPSYDSGSHLLKYPNQFGLSFKHNEFLFTMGTAVLKNFNVDYHGEGTPLYYDAGSANRGARKLLAPAVVKISCEFQEISIITKAGIENAGR